MKSDAVKWKKWLISLQKIDPDNNYGFGKPEDQLSYAQDDIELVDSLIKKNKVDQLILYHQQHQIKEFIAFLEVQKGPEEVD